MKPLPSMAKMVNHKTLSMIMVETNMVILKATKETTADHRRPMISRPQMESKSAGNSAREE